MSNLFRHIPAVDKVLADQAIARVSSGLAKTELTYLVRDFLAQTRRNIAARQKTLTYEEIIRHLETHLKNYKLHKFQLVINATGVLLHTNLGRAPLPANALQRLQELGRGYFNLEINLETGERGSRYTNIAHLFNLLSCPGDDRFDTVIVNNNAAAVLVTLKTLAAGAEVLVSRGQLVEIGGGFRIPEVITAGGCLLKEVGTTNRTRLSDYQRAITPQTKAILLVHPSNYSIIGFTETVSRRNLARLAEKHGLVLIEDIGSGAFRPFGEPLVATALQDSHIVTYSGDKLLGGAQAGIITGYRDLIRKIKREPLLRAMRIDKLSLIVLEAVLEHYLNKDFHKLPLWAMANIPEEEIKSRALGWLARLGPGLQGEVLSAPSTMGGGSLPGETIPSWSLVLHSEEFSSAEIAARLRRGRPAILTRVIQDRVWLDPRTVFDWQDQTLGEILEEGMF